jgi:hypothetical protein
MGITFSCLLWFSIILVHLFISLDYQNGSQTMWDKYFSFHHGKTLSLTTHIGLQLKTYGSFSFLIKFEWCKKLWEHPGKFYIISLSSRSTEATHGKHKTCQNQIMCFFQKWPIILKCHILLNLSDLKSYGCTKLSFTLHFEASNAKNQWKTITKGKNGMCESYDLTLTLPTFNAHIFFMFDLFWG